MPYDLLKDLVAVHGTGARTLMLVTAHRKCLKKIKSGSLKIFFIINVEHRPFCVCYNIIIFKVKHKLVLNTKLNT